LGDFKVKKAKKDLKRDFQNLISRLESMIMVGELQPRDRLVEISLAKKMAVSRTSIRDAIKVLENKGLVVITPYKGAMVNDLNEQEIEEIDAVRVNLVQFANRLACENLKKSDIKELEKRARRVEEGVRLRSYQEMISSNIRFHEYIYEIAGNRILTQTIKQLEVRYHVFRHYAWSSPNIIKQILKEHKQIIAAMKNQDTDLLDKINSVHIGHSKELYLSQIKARRNLVST
jgi:DNA-binding GntR family transcriptional regulator